MSISQITLFTMIRSLKNEQFRLQMRWSQPATQIQVTSNPSLPSNRILTLTSVMDKENSPVTHVVSKEDEQSMHKYVEAINSDDLWVRTSLKKSAKSVSTWGSLIMMCVVIVMINNDCQNLKTLKIVVKEFLKTEINKSSNQLDDATSIKLLCEADHSKVGASSGMKLFLSIKVRAAEILTRRVHHSANRRESGSFRSSP